MSTYNKHKLRTNVVFSCQNILPEIQVKWVAQYFRFMQLFSADNTIFKKEIIFLPQKTWKKLPSKVAHNLPKKYCRTAQNHK